MTKLFYSLNISVPLNMCYDYVANYIHEKRFVHASASLLKIDSPLRIVNNKVDSSIKFKVNGVDPITKQKMSGWELNYSFFQTTKGFTQINISIEYGFLLSLIGLGTMGFQAKNELVNIINTLLAFEKGYELTEAIVPLQNVNQMY